MPHAIQVGWRYSRRHTTLNNRTYYKDCSALKLFPWIFAKTLHARQYPIQQVMCSIFVNIRQNFVRTAISTVNFLALQYNGHRQSPLPSALASTFSPSRHKMSLRLRAKKISSGKPALSVNIIVIERGVYLLNVAVWIYKLNTFISNRPFPDFM